MRTSDRILRQVRRALIAAFALSGCAALLLAALALHALPLLSRELSLAQPERLWLLASSAALIVFVALCVGAARARVLQRAGLWLDHTLAHHVLLGAARAGVPANTLKGDWAAIARLRDALTGRAVLPMLDAPWTVIAIAVLAVLHPLLAAVACVCAIALLMTAVAQAAPVARLEQQRLRASERVAAWWRNLPPSPLPADAAQHWEQLNRTHVAAAYLLDRRLLLLRDWAHALRALALSAAILVGVWLASTNELTLGALVAAVALVALALAPFVALVAELKPARRALLDYRRLADQPDTRRAVGLAAVDGQHLPLPAFTAPVPRLHIGGPLALGFGAALLLIAASASAVTLLPQQITSLAVDAHAAPRAVPVKHAKGGIAARLHVAQGAEVKAGDILITLDTTTLDRLIAALKADADVARRQLEMVTREAADLAGLSPATIADRIKLRALEDQIAELRTRTEALPARILDAEADLARSIIRAPVSGRVIALSVHAPSDAIAPGAIVAEITPVQQPNLLAQLAEPWLRKMHRMLRSFYQENAA